MVIFQILFTVVAFGLAGFILYWVSVFLHTGLNVTQQEVNNDPRV
jgi:hypothetical protein